MSQGDEGCGCKSEIQLLDNVTQVRHSPILCTHAVKLSRVTPLGKSVTEK
jgi:hypothetical protein